RDLPVLARHGARRVNRTRIAGDRGRAHHPHVPAARRAAPVRALHTSQRPGEAAGALQKGDQGTRGNVRPRRRRTDRGGIRGTRMSGRTLKGKTLLITGGSRGIGLAIAKRAAADGANVAIVAKTAEPHPKLPGTIFTAATEIEAAGGKALAIQADIRFEDQVE